MGGVSRSFPPVFDRAEKITRCCSLKRVESSRVRSLLVLICSLGSKFGSSSSHLFTCIIVIINVLHISWTLPYVPPDRLNPSVSYSVYSWIGFVGLGLGFRGEMRRDYWAGSVRWPAL